VNLRQAFGAVFWSFLGVRKGTHYDEDARNLKPQQVIVVGLVCALIFVLVLFGIVKLVTR
jgi:amino acid transporter